MFVLHSSHNQPAYEKRKEPCSVFNRVLRNFLDVRRNTNELDSFLLRGTLCLSKSTCTCTCTYSTCALGAHVMHTCMYNMKCMVCVGDFFYQNIVWKFVILFTNKNEYVFANLHNFQIVLHKLEINKVQANFETGILFRNYTVQFWNMNMFLSIAHLISIYCVRICI